MTLDLPSLDAWLDHARLGAHLIAQVNPDRNDHGDDLGEMAAVMGVDLGRDSLRGMAFALAAVQMILAANEPALDVDDPRYGIAAAAAFGWVVSGILAQLDRPDHV